MITDFSPAYVLGSEGPIAKVFKNYQVRPQQITLSENIRTAFAEEKHLVAEAATGTGKSFAFLLPAFEKALSSKQPVVISTHTIALQEQLFDKDIPFLKDKLGLNFVKTTLSKGRGNYLSLRRLEVAEKTSKNDKQYNDFVKWTRSNKSDGTPPDGSKSSIDFKYDASFWNKVRSDSDQCYGEKCHNFKKCFFQNARKNVEESQIIVTNHNIVLIDRKMKAMNLKGILPEYSCLILDEAHEFEEVARKAFTFEFSNTDILSTLFELYNNDGSGFLNTLQTNYSSRHLDLLTGGLKQMSQKEEESYKVVKTAVSSVKQLFEENDLFFKKIREFMGDKKIKRFKTPNSVTTTYLDKFKQLADSLKSLNETLTDKNEKIVIDYVSKKSIEIVDGLEKILTLPNVEGKSYPDFAAWASQEDYGKNKSTSVTCSPIFLKGLLKRYLFSNIKSVIMTSATLATGGNDPFKMFKSSIGVENPIECKLPPVFNYEKQAKIYVAANMPEQSDPSYIKQMSDQIYKFVVKTGGGAFVLFTSNKTMNDVYEKCKTSLEMDGYKLFIQGGDIDKKRMIDGFKNCKNGVLFGVQSFWTGIDIPGDSLRNVIITKLPFNPPDNPLAEAQQEIYEKFKMNFFMEREIPHTTIKLKQGFGRLIRTSTDKGIIVLLDSRLLTKRYGKMILASLPSCPVEKFSV